jgi:hypothetical protein
MLRTLAFLVEGLMVRTYFRSPSSVERITIDPSAHPAARYCPVYSLSEGGKGSPSSLSGIAFH